MLRQKDPGRIQEYLKSHEEMESRILQDIHQILWHMNGAVTRQELLEMPAAERDMLVKMIEKKLEKQQGAMDGRRTRTVTM